jgi:hypothetical protein
LPTSRVFIASAKRFEIELDAPGLGGTQIGEDFSWTPPKFSTFLVVFLTFS